MNVLLVSVIVIVLFLFCTSVSVVSCVCMFLRLCDALLLYFVNLCSFYVNKKIGKLKKKLAIYLNFSFHMDPEE